MKSIIVQSGLNAFDDSGDGFRYFLEEMMYFFISAKKTNFGKRPAMEFAFKC
jgi:hypothetical protein